MKREILFRGKDIETGEWIEGGVCIGDNYAHIVRQITQHVKRDDYECYAIEVAPVTVSQFTGLIDKNGKKIFEGDILNFADTSQPHNAVVEFNTEDVASCGCCYSCFDGAGFVGRVIPGSDYRYSCFSGNFKESEIIGNIFDNPELVVKNE
jgi:uncharacterized phage protein (TIGR01671 family)